MNFTIIRDFSPRPMLFNKHEIRDYEPDEEYEIEVEEEEEDEDE